ncbi:hypothetical protein V6243_07905 [Cobetia marina]|uniref:Uncharacterized protein n=1 Tax=Cobetia marina TaxID=28258 RepID=A0ABU9GGW7_COBMA
MHDKKNAPSTTRRCTASSAKSDGIHRARVNDNFYNKLIRALENPRYKYRSVDGVAKEIGLDHGKLLKLLNHHSDEIVVLNRKGNDGQILITTRKHYDKNASKVEKIKSVLMNRMY